MARWASGIHRGMAFLTELFLPAAALVVVPEGEAPGLGWSQRLPAAICGSAASIALSTPLPRSTCLPGEGVLASLSQDASVEHGLPAPATNHAGSACWAAPPCRQARAGRGAAVFLLGDGRLAAAHAAAAPPQPAQCSSRAARGSSCSCNSRRQQTAGAAAARRRCRRQRCWPAALLQAAALPVGRRCGGGSLGGQLRRGRPRLPCWIAAGCPRRGAAAAATAATAAAARSIGACSRAGGEAGSTGGPGSSVSPVAAAAMVTCRHRDLDGLLRSGARAGCTCSSAVRMRQPLPRPQPHGLLA